MTPNSVVKPQWAHLEYRWKLENFWELRALAGIEALEDDSGDVVWSKLFGDKTRGLWRLKVYPYGDSSSSGKGHVSLFLSLNTAAMPPPKKAYAIFSCYVMDDKGNKIAGSGRSFTRQRFAEGCSSWGWSQFIKVEDQSLNRVLVNDSLTIKCDIDVFLGMRATPAREIPTCPKMADEIRQYLQESADAHDVTLVLGDKTHTASSFLLCARSKVFRSALLPLLSGASQNRTTQTNSGNINTNSNSNIVSTVRLIAPAAFSNGPENQAHSSSFASVTVNSASSSSALGSAKPRQASLVPSAAYISFESAATTASSSPHQFSAAAPGAPLVPGARKNSEDVPVAAEPSAFERSANLVVELPTNLSQMAVSQLLEYINTDECTLLEQSSPDLSKLLEVFIAAAQLQVQSLVAACVEVLMGRLTGKADAQMILAAAQEVGHEALASECRSFLYYATKELEGEELLRALLSTSTIQPQVLSASSSKVTESGSK